MATALREIHRIHRQLTDLRTRLERGPRQIRVSEAQVQDLAEKGSAAKASLKKTRMAADDKQLQLRQREDRIKDLQVKLNSCGSNREYQALKEQIAADEQANSVLSDEILEALELLDELQIAAANHEAEHQKAQAALEQLQTRVRNEQSGLEAELQRVSDELQRVEQQLPAEIRLEYERMARARGEDALAPVENETCAGCFQRLSPQTMNNLILGRAVFCSSCGALLYLPEDTSPMG
jgi:predicted  nucleic acid-binding Zn-ribbon protein